MSKFWRHMQVTLLISARQMLQPVARDSEAKWTSLRSHWERLMPSSSGCDNFFDFTPQCLLGPAFYHHKTNWPVEETSALWESTNWESPFIFKHLLIVSLRSVIHVVTSEKRNIKAVRILLLFFFLTVRNVTWIVLVKVCRGDLVFKLSWIWNVSCHACFFSDFVAWIS